MNLTVHLVNSDHVLQSFRFKEKDDCENNI